MALHALPKIVSRFTSRQHLTPLRTSVRCLALAAHQPITLRSTNPPRPPPLHSARVLPTHLHSSSLFWRQQSTQVPTNQGNQGQSQGAVQSFPDPDRPDLFYHLFAPPTALSSTMPVFALSFLASPPSSILSSTILGWLPASGEGDGAGLNDFVENERFRELMHEAIRSALRDGADEVQQNSAVQTREGWMHIHDGRNIPALGRIGDPDDIIASVRVEEGEILAETYQPMPSYRLCTSDGVLQLTEGLAARLVEVLEARVREEQKQV